MGKIILFTRQTRHSRCWRNKNNTWPLFLMRQRLRRVSVVFNDVSSVAKMLKWLYILRIYEEIHLQVNICFSLRTLQKKKIWFFLLRLLLLKIKIMRYKKYKTATQRVKNRKKKTTASYFFHAFLKRNFVKKIIMKIRHVCPYNLYEITKIYNFYIYSTVGYFFRYKYCPCTFFL